MHNKDRGYALERRIRQVFESAGFTAKRSAHSKTPDLVVSKDGAVIFGLECKHQTQRVSTPIYIPKRQTELLLEFSQKYGVPSYIIFSFYRKPAKIIGPEKLRKTETGNSVIESLLQEDEKVPYLKDFIVCQLS